MNNQQLETRLSVGIKAIGLLVIILVLHSASSVLNNLGILTDLFIIIGVYQAGQFLINKETRQNIISKAKELVDTESIDNMVSEVAETINKTIAENKQETNTEKE